MIKKILFGFFLIFATLYAHAQEYRVATYNIRLYNTSDTGNLWEQRSPYLINLVRYHNFDIFGTQEGFKNQLDLISDSLPFYERFGAGRDDGKEAGEHSAIYFKKEKFSLVKGGNFWLSETPDVPGKGWDAKCCNRICSWVQLKDKKTGATFFVFNVHFDHEGMVARRESAKLILEKINTLVKGAPVVLTGDFNGNRGTEWYKALATSGVLRDTYTDVKNPYQPGSSFNGFGKSLTGNGIIDHVFISKQWKAKSWGLLTDTYSGKFPSDHFPVLTELTIQKP